MSVKKIIGALLAVFFLHAPTTFAGNGSLQVYTWVSYMPEWVVEEFNRETGVEINFTYFASNEIMLANMEKGGFSYDIVTPSGEFVPKLKEAGLLHSLDHRRLPGISNLMPRLAHNNYDPGCQYSLPLLWGVVGLIVNNKLIDPGKVNSYADLWNQELSGRIMLPNDLRSTMSIMLLSLGYSINDKDPAHIKEAFGRLKKLAPNVQTFNTVDALEAMEENKVAVGVSWNQIGFFEKANKERYTFVLPAEGMPIWVDTIAIPANAKNLDAAYKFLEFILRPDVAARLSQDSGYSTPNQEAWGKLDEDVRNNRCLYPEEELLNKMEMETPLPPDLLPALERDWNKLTSGK